MAKTQQRRVFGAVSTVLMAGHGIVVVAALGFGLLIWVELSPARFGVGRWKDLYLGGIVATPCVHLLLMWVSPLWAWLGARRQSRVSRLWAWLGYFIPFAGFWLPVSLLRRLADGGDAEAARLRLLIAGWGVARGLSSLSAMIGIFYVLYKSGMTGYAATVPIVIYLVITISAANLLSLLMIGQMRHYLAATSVDTRHAEVFA